MLKYTIYTLQDYKVIYDFEKHLERRHKSNTECYVKKFPIETTDEEIKKYIDEKLGGNPEFSL